MTKQNTLNFLTVLSFCSMTNTCSWHVIVILQKKFVKNSFCNKLITWFVFNSEVILLIETKKSTQSVSLMKIKNMYSSYCIPEHVRDMNHNIFQGTEWCEVMLGRLNRAMYRQFTSRFCVYNSLVIPNKQTRVK